MTWSISFSGEAVSFLRKARRLSEGDVVELAQRAIRMFGGERINVDVKKLKGEWTGFYRIRKGKLRIIASFDFERRSALVDRVDWRGGAYR